MQPNQRFAITDQEINVVVATFYKRVRRDAVLGPIFGRVVPHHEGGWPAHEAKIASFWRNAIGIDRSYTGSPMRAHMQNGEVRAEHFAVWLGLFHEVLVETLEPQIAASWGALADRIGAGLSYGIAGSHGEGDGPPILTRQF